MARFSSQTMKPTKSGTCGTREVEIMSSNLVAEDLARRVVQVAGSPIAISSHRLGNTYYAKAEIDQPGAKARIAQAEGKSREEAEGKGMGGVQRALGKKS